MTPLELDFRIYRRPMARALRTAHGRWSVREGLVLRIRDAEGRTGYGEMAPLPWFGTETLEDCVELCRALGPVVTIADLRGVVLPCARFAAGSALAMLRGMHPAQDKYRVAGLLPEGATALDVVRARLAEGFTTFKAKVVEGDDEELDAMMALLGTLRDAGALLRIDANGALDAARAARWFKALATRGDALEFIEQPMPVGQEATMRALMQEHGVTVALDESVGSPVALQRFTGWPGVLVVKPALHGDPLDLGALPAVRGGRFVLSSALETAVGVRGALLAAGPGGAALGFGVDVWPADDPLGVNVTGAYLDVGTLGGEYLDRLWNHIGSS